MSQVPPHAHRVDFDFETPLTPLNSLNLVLNFGNTAPQQSVLNARLNTRLNAVITGSNTENAVNLGQLNASLKTKFTAQINGTNWESIDNRGTLQASIKTSMQASIIADNNINHMVGISLGLSARFEKAIASLSVTKIPWAKPTLRVSNEALFYDQSLVITSNIQLQFDEADHLSRAVRLVHEQTTNLQSDVIAVFENAERRFIYQRYVQDEALKLRHNREMNWEEMIRRRKQFTYSHEVAQQIEHCFSLEYDLGLQIVTKSDIPWDVGKAIHYRKHPVQPWPKPKKPKYVGSTDLNFICLCHEIDAHNVVLNFGQDDCIPALPRKKWWYMTNTLYAERLDTGERIAVLDGTYQTSRSQFCWSYSITIVHEHKEKLQPIDNQPVILKLMINGYEHHVLLESPSETRRFARKTYTYSGRSVAALNSADYAPKRSFIQDNQREAAALVQAELERAQAGTTLNWQLIDELGWAVPLNGLSYAELAPMDAIKQIVEVGGGFIYSEKSGNTLSILPRYKKAHWDAMTVDDYDILIPESAVIQQTIDPNLDYVADYNAIKVFNSRSGDSWSIQRTIANNVPLPDVLNPMYDAVSAASFGKAALIQANVQELHTLSDLPVTTDLGEMLPGKTVAFHGQWWGVIDVVNGSFTHAKVTETIKVERIHRDESIA